MQRHTHSTTYFALLHYIVNELFISLLFMYLFLHQIIYIIILFIYFYYLVLFMFTSNCSFRCNF